MVVSLNLRITAITVRGYITENTSSSGCQAEAWHLSWLLTLSSSPATVPILSADHLLSMIPEPGYGRTVQLDHTVYVDDTSRYEACLNWDF